MQLSKERLEERCLAAPGWAGDKVDLADGKLDLGDVETEVAQVVGVAVPDECGTAEADLALGLGLLMRVRFGNSGRRGGGQAAGEGIDEVALGVIFVTITQY